MHHRRPSSVTSSPVSPFSDSKTFNKIAELMKSVKLPCVVTSSPIAHHDLAKRSAASRKKYPNNPA